MVGVGEPLDGEDDGGCDVGDPDHGETGRGRIVRGAGDDLLGVGDRFRHPTGEVRAGLPAAVRQRVREFETAVARVAGLPSASLGVRQRLLGGDPVRLHLGEFGGRVRQFRSHRPGVDVQFPAGREFPAQGRDPLPEIGLPLADFRDTPTSRSEIERRGRAVRESLLEIADRLVLWRGRAAGPGSECEQSTPAPDRSAVDAADEPVERTGRGTVETGGVSSLGLGGVPSPDRLEDVADAETGVGLPEVDSVADVGRLVGSEAHRGGREEWSPSDQSGSSASSSGAGWVLPTANFAYEVAAVSRFS